LERAREHVWVLAAAYVLTVTDSSLEIVLIQIVGPLVYLRRIVKYPTHRYLEYIIVKDLSQCV
jgi:hypothetical protein